MTPIPLATRTLLEDHERLKTAFLRYVSPKIAQMASAQALHRGGEMRDATVLFTDIRNFTSLSELLEPPAIVHMLNRYFETMAARIEAEGGEINKFLGDGMMAIFAGEDPAADAYAAVRATIAMERAIALFNTEQRFLGLPEITHGCGIASGRVILGIVGSKDRLEYTAMGDTVNTASRIEGLTKKLRTDILLDEATCERLAGRIPLRARGSCEVKGKSQPVRIFALTLR